MEDNMHTWDDDQIREFYDNKPNLSLSTYSGMLGLSVGELKEILMPSPKETRTEYCYRMGFDM